MRDEAIVEGVELGVAHDTDGLVLVELRYPNGASGHLRLDGRAVARLVEQLELRSVQELVGRGFSEIAAALPTNARP